ncbi:MAG: hypothetical protein QOH90_2186 [Actinomycetota bacterium]|jgi:hypothetical protein|nr:hypothetical protein [Actinomycetota bacterium]
MALAPVAANAAAADALSLSRAAAPMSGFSFLQAADDDDDDNGGTMVILGVVLVVLIGIAAISGNNKEVSNSP